MSQSKVLADRIYSGEGIAADALRVAAANILLVLCAHIAIPLPWTPVPITGQTFGVLLAAVLLGARRGAIALILYLLEGAAGLPVFQPLGLPGFAAKYIGDYLVDRASGNDKNASYGHLGYEQEAYKNAKDIEENLKERFGDSNVLYPDAGSRSGGDADQ